MVILNFSFLKKKKAAGRHGFHGNCTFPVFFHNPIRIIFPAKVQNVLKFRIAKVFIDNEISSVK